MRKILVATALAGAMFTPVAALAQAPAAAAPAAYSTAATTIGDLLDNPQTKAIVDKYLPGFSSNAQADMARPMTFRGIQSYAPEQMTDEALGKIDADLAKLPPKKN